MAITKFKSSGIISRCGSKNSENINRRMSNTTAKLMVIIRRTRQALGSLCSLIGLKRILFTIFLDVIKGQTKKQRRSLNNCEYWSLRSQSPILTIKVPTLFQLSTPPMLLPRCLLDPGLHISLLRAGDRLLAKEGAGWLHLGLPKPACCLHCSSWSRFLYRILHIKLVKPKHELQWGLQAQFCLPLALAPEP